MARNSNLITHIMQDPNSKYHLAIGFGVALAAIAIDVIFNANYLPFLFAAVAAVSIEVYQRLALNGQNTMRESVFDALTTALPGFIVSVTLYIIDFIA